MSDQYDGPALAAQIIKLQKENERLRAERIDLKMLAQDAIAERDRLRAEVVDLFAESERRQNTIDHLCAELAEANERLHEVREIYAGMEGFCADTAPEAYLQRIVRQMYEAAKEKK